MPRMMQGEAQQIAIKYVNDNLPPLIDTADCVFPNASGDRENGKPFLKMEVLWFNGLKINAGLSSLWRTPGALVIEIMFPKGQGDIESSVVLDQLTTLFRNNAEFRSLGFAIEGTQVDPDDANNNQYSEYYKQTLNIFFNIEGA